MWTFPFQEEFKKVFYQIEYNFGPLNFKFLTVPGTIINIQFSLSWIIFS